MINNMGKMDAISLSPASGLRWEIRGFKLPLGPN
jgi:hypothetical protein